jgi:hypothetical protein
MAPLSFSMVAQFPEGLARTLSKTSWEEMPTSLRALQWLGSYLAHHRIVGSRRPLAFCSADVAPPHLNKEGSCPKWGFPNMNQDG